jgi:hypothetical protein
VLAPAATPDIVTGASERSGSFVDLAAWRGFYLTRGTEDWRASYDEKGMRPQTGARQRLPVLSSTTPPCLTRRSCVISATVTGIGADGILRHRQRRK